MRTLQLIDADSDRATRLAVLFERAGWLVQSTSCALSALTAIEWDRPDVVLVHADLDGISACELCTTIKHDPTLEGVRVMLYAAYRANERVKRGFDLTITSDEPADIATALGPPDSPPAPRHGRALALPAHTQGGLPRLAGGLQLDTVIESLIEAVVTGRLTLSLRGSATTHAILFDQGQVIHAVGGDLVGLDALSYLLHASKRGEGLWYQFDKIPLSAVDRSPRSIVPLELAQILELTGLADDHGSRKSDAELARLGQA